jgi:cobyrinic acid a,c-diamide synthase
MVSIPRVVVAAAASGHGKTSIATGLLAALRARGLSVSPHKVGPDYIDPGYHGLAAGRVGRNLDPWLVGEERIVPLFLNGAMTPTLADIAIVEGVMGLFDGATGMSGFASTAHVSTLLSAPVVLVVDAAAVGRSVAALVHGFATFDPTVRLGGVILNRVGSDRHREILVDALGEVGVPVLGAVRRQEELMTPSRHLGLIPAAERASEARRTVQALGEVIARDVDLESVLQLAKSAPDLDGSRRWSPEPADADVTALLEHRPVIAIAGGPAFTFSYAETSELLTAAGADVATFDPTVDEALPMETAGVVIGGGFPEVHAPALAANASLRAAIAAHVERGGVVAAECAGLLYLAQTLDGHPMCQVLPTSAAMTKSLKIGYREAVALESSLLLAAGARVRGHEFHRTQCLPASGDAQTGTSAAWRWRGGDGAVVTEGFASPTVHASYLHLHWAGVPGAAHRLVAAARLVAS